MRAANVLGLIIACLWLGGCLALGVSAVFLFVLVNPDTNGGLDVNHIQLGEIFGIMFKLWTYVGLGCLAGIVLTRLVAWAMQMKQRQFGLAQAISVAVLAALIVTTLAAARATLAAGAAHEAMEKAREPEAEKTALADFNLAHKASRERSNWMVIALALVIGGLGIGLARRGRDSASAPGEGA